jgi:hypothetical protein
LRTLQRHLRDVHHGEIADEDNTHGGLRALHYWILQAPIRSKMDSKSDWSLAKHRQRSSRVAGESRYICTSFLKHHKESELVVEIGSGKSGTTVKIAGAMTVGERGVSPSHDHLIRLVGRCQQQTFVEAHVGGSHSGQETRNMISRRQPCT